MKKFRFLSAVVVLALSVMLLAACTAQNSVRLMYQPAGAAAIPSATAPRIAVVMFDDARGRMDIGVRKDGASFEPVSNVQEWVTHALADELARQGAQVSLAMNLQQAMSSRPDYVITGSVDQVWLVEKSINTYSAAIRLQARIKGGSEPELTRKFSSSQEKTGIPGMRLVEDTLSGTLADVLGNMSSAFMSSIR